MDYLVTLGHNARRWTDYTITSPTEQEVATLEKGGDEAVRLLASLVETGRATFLSWRNDRVEDPFDKSGEPDVFDLMEV